MSQPPAEFTASDSPLQCQPVEVPNTRVLRLTYDRLADAAYIYLQPATVAQPSVVTTLTVDETINLDFDDRGRLVGIDVLGARNLRPELLAEATDGL